MGRRRFGNFSAAREAQDARGEGAARAEDRILGVAGDRGSLLPHPRTPGCTHLLISLKYKALLSFLHDRPNHGQYEKSFFKKNKEKKKN
ncbi:hypothetical protein [uncultured Mailhella sp.]|uniref:hypothetical protein n=1 Tax=uncultured Mailhella sp. TaxID=1981031 RepID=UPI0025DD3C54|nr:hypothetical protein [uncultured Mailhella sp.]